MESAPVFCFTTQYPLRDLASGWFPRFVGIVKHSDFLEDARIDPGRRFGNGGGDYSSEIPSHCDPSPGRVR